MVNATRGALSTAGEHGVRPWHPSGAHGNRHGALRWPEPDGPDMSLGMDVEAGPAMCMPGIAEDADAIWASIGQTRPLPSTTSWAMRRSVKMAVIRKRGLILARAVSSSDPPNITRR